MYLFVNFFFKINIDNWPRIPHHNDCACLNYIWEQSIRYRSLFAVFTPLHSSTNQELFKKHVRNQSSHYKKYNGAMRPSYPLKLKYPLPFSVSYVRLVKQQYESRSVWKAPLY